MYLCTGKQKSLKIQPQTFKPFATEDTSSALYFHGRSMDESPVLFSIKQDSSIIHQVKPIDYKTNSHFFSEVGNPESGRQSKQKPDNDFLFITALIVPIIITLWIFKSVFPRIQGAFRAAFNNRFASIFMRNFSISNHLSTYIILLNTAISSSVGFWIFLLQKDIITDENNTQALLMLLSGIIGYYLYRYIVIYLAKVIFMTHEATEHYLYRDYYINAIISGILPFLIFAAAFSPATDIIWPVIVAIIALLQAYRLLLAIYTGILERTYGLFYFILYFCTVEIVPVAIILKLIAERISQ